MILLLAALLASSIPPIELHRTETERAGSPPFDLPATDPASLEFESCRVEETLPMGAGTAEKRRCPGRLDAETAKHRCKQAARHDSLPHGVTAESCLADYQHGRFLFTGELREVIVTRARDGAPGAAFAVLEGDVLATFQPVSDAVLIGIGTGDRVRYAVVSSRGVLRAPALGEEAVDVDVAHGRIRVTGRARAMQVDLVPRNGTLVVERK